MAVYIRSCSLPEETAINEWCLKLVLIIDAKCIFLLFKFFFMKTRFSVFLFCYRFVILRQLKYMLVEDNFL